jgi:uncharacterized protein (DUF983 family)
MRRGFMGRCPQCGEGRMFRAYLKVADVCPVCGEELHHHRADDAPPWLTMLIAGHVLVALALVFEDYGPAVPALVEVLIFGVLTLVLCLALLPRIKGMLIGLQWALRMHGFHGPNDEVFPES